MALTKISTDGVKDDAVTAGKIPANAVGSSELADNAVDTAAIADQAVDLTKLPHGTGSNDGKFLRANNGADPTFETITGTTINNNADNRVITGSGTANTLEGEANLSFNGNLLHLNSGSSGLPKLRLQHSGAGNDVFEITSGLTGVSNGGFGIYDVDASAYRFAVNSSGKVGIGTTSPTTLLEVKDTSTHSGVSITADNASTSAVNLGDEDDINIGRVLYDHSNDSMQFQAYNAERMRIVSNGEVGINITNPETYGLNGTGYGGLVVQAPSGGYSGITIRSSYAGGGALFFADGNSSNAERKNLGLTADHVNKRMDIRVEGNGVARFTSHGFHPNPSDSAAANALDDYEEGSFTPVLENDGNTSYTHQEGRYVKIGRLVHVNVFVKINNEDSGATNVTGIDNMPFTNGASNVITFLITGNNGWDASLSSTNFAGWMPSGQNNARFYKNSGSNLNGISVNDIGSDGEIAISVTYQT